MVYAFIMVETVSGQSESVREAVEGFDDVRETHVVAGRFDVVVEVDAAEVYDVLHAASTSIQGTEGVSDTTTYVALD
jgi:DNA-binding Lrp family transcriptional regulator